MTTKSVKPESHVQYASHLNQCSGSGSRGGRDAVLLDAVEAAAVDLPHLAADAALAIRLRRLLEMVVERDEVERRADPDDPRGDVEPAEDEVEPVDEIRVYREHQRSSAIATSSPSAVSRSSSVGFGRRARSTSRISAFGRRLTKTTKRKP